MSYLMESCMWYIEKREKCYAKIAFGEYNAVIFASNDFIYNHRSGTYFRARASTANKSMFEKDTQYEIPLWPFRVPKPYGYPLMGNLTVLLN